MFGCVETVLYFRVRCGETGETVEYGDIGGVRRLEWTGKGDSQNTSQLSDP